MARDFGDAVLLLFVLLNPFLLTVYLLGLMERLELRTFGAVIIRAGVISTGAFILFALTGDALFRQLQIRFSAFLVFGGALFFIIGLRYALQGPMAIEQLRGEPEYVAGAVAMPFMIGPATVSASMMAGAHLPAWLAVAAIALAVTLVGVSVTLLKWLHDRVRTTHTAIVDRYVEVVGRISSLVIGTIAVGMVMRGVEKWLAQLP